MPGFMPDGQAICRKKVAVMSKQEEIFRRYEKLAKAAKKSAPELKDKPGSCARCIYYRPDFRYRKCQFSRCPYTGDTDVFRKRPLKRDKFSGNEVVKMNG